MWEVAWQRGRVGRHLRQTDESRAPSFPGHVSLPVPNGGNNKDEDSPPEKQALLRSISLLLSWTWRAALLGGMQSYTLPGEVNLLKEQGRASTVKQNRNRLEMISSGIEAKTTELPSPAAVCWGLTGESLGAPIKETAGLVLRFHTTPGRAARLWNSSPSVDERNPHQTKTDFWMGWAVSSLGFQ